MSEKDQEKMLELLSDKAIFGLSEAELAELAELEKDYPELNDESLDLAAASIGMLNLNTSEAMPAHLRAKIEAEAEKYFSARSEDTSPAAVPPKEAELQPTFTFEPKKSIWNWLGWAVAAFACIALAVNIYTTRRSGGSEIGGLQPTPTATPEIKLTPAEQRQRLLASATDVVQSTWSDFDPKKPKNVEGDVVWSNSLQKGFMRFRNLPVNEKSQGTYQVWIFDKQQKNPVSGGVFDIDENGEVIVPIDSALKIQEPTMFGITAEKPGGVMVSDLKNVMAVAKLAA